VARLDLTRSRPVLHCVCHRPGLRTAASLASIRTEKMAVRLNRSAFLVGMCEMEARLSHAIDVCAAKLEATYLAATSETLKAMQETVDAVFNAMRLMPGAVSQDETGEEFVSHEKTRWLTEQVVLRMLNGLETRLCDALGVEFSERHRTAVRAEVADMFAEIMELFEESFSKT
jgi:hypothetical protein